MNLGKLQECWNALGETDPLWAILADPAKKGGKWDWDDFFRTGECDIEKVLGRVAAQGIEIHHGKALDFGCGVGRLTQALGLHFEECVGVDIAPSMIRLAREHNRRGARCRYELNAHPDLRLFADNTFDFVYSTLVLQHMRPTMRSVTYRNFCECSRPVVASCSLCPADCGRFGDLHVAW